MSERDEFNQLVRNTIGPEVYDLLTKPPADPLKLSHCVLKACDNSYKSKLQTKGPDLPRRWDGKDWFKRSVDGYDFPKVLGLDGVNASGAAMRFTVEGKRSNYKLYSEVLDSKDAVTTRFSGAVDNGGTMTANPPEVIREQEYPAYKIVGAALAYRNTFAAVPNDWRAQEHAIDMREQGYELLWVRRDGTLAPGQ